MSALPPPPLWHGVVAPYREETYVEPERTLAFRSGEGERAVQDDWLTLEDDDYDIEEEFDALINALDASEKSALAGTDGEVAQRLDALSLGEPPKVPGASATATTAAVQPGLESLDREQRYSLGTFIVTVIAEKEIEADALRRERQRQDREAERRRANRKRGHRGKQPKEEQEAVRGDKAAEPRVETVPVETSSAAPRLHSIAPDEQETAESHVETTPMGTSSAAQRLRSIAHRHRPDDHPPASPPVDDASDDSDIDSGTLSVASAASAVGEAHPFPSSLPDATFEERYTRLLLSGLELSGTQRESILYLLSECVNGNVTRDQRRALIDATVPLVGDVPVRFGALQALLTLSLSTGVYDARSRAFLRRASLEMKVPWRQMTMAELAVAALLVHQGQLAQQSPTGAPGVRGLFAAGERGDGASGPDALLSEFTGDDYAERAKKRYKRKSRRRALKVVAIALGGGAVFGLAGALAAPLLLPALVGIGITGASTLAATGTVASGAVVASFFGGLGVGYVGHKARKRTRMRLTDFDLEPLGIEEYASTKRQPAATEPASSTTSSSPPLPPVTELSTPSRTSANAPADEAPEVSAGAQAILRDEVERALRELEHDPTERPSREASTSEAPDESTPADSDDAEHSDVMERQAVAALRGQSARDDGNGDATAFRADTSAADGGSHARKSKSSWRRYLRPWMRRKKGASSGAEPRPYHGSKDVAKHAAAVAALRANQADRPAASDSLASNAPPPSSAAMAPAAPAAMPPPPPLPPPSAAASPLDAPHGLQVALFVPGWLTKSYQEGACASQFYRSIGNGRLLRCAERYALRWEPRQLYEMGRAFFKFWTTKAATSAAQQAAPYVFQGLSMAAGALVSSIAWPLAVYSAADAVDGPWSVLLNRANAAGDALADVLALREHGQRPVTLIGYSHGARVVFKCLEALADAGVYGVVDEAYLIGAPCTGDGRRWLRASRAVAGRLVNAYCGTDWALALFHRGSSGEFRVAGLAPIRHCGGRVENVNLALLGLQGHRELREALPRILTALGVETGRLSFPPILLRDVQLLHEEEESARHRMGMGSEGSEEEEEESGAEGGAGEARSGAKGHGKKGGRRRGRGRRAQRMVTDERGRAWRRDKYVDSDDERQEEGREARGWLLREEDTPESGQREAGDVAAAAEAVSLIDVDVDGKPAGIQAESRASRARRATNLSFDAILDAPMHDHDEDGAEAADVDAEWTDFQSVQPLSTGGAGANTLVHSLGIETAGGHFLPVIAAGTRMPCERTVVLTTCADHQESVSLFVYQGEKKQLRALGAKRARRDHRLLRMLEFQGFASSALQGRGRAGTARIELTLALDAHGNLEVSVRDMLGAQRLSAMVPASRMARERGAFDTDEAEAEEKQSRRKSKWWGRSHPRPEPETPADERPEARRSVLYESGPAPDAPA